MKLDDPEYLICGSQSPSKNFRINQNRRDISTRKSNFSESPIKELNSSVSQRRKVLHSQNGIMNLSVNLDSRKEEDLLADWP